jgi:NAD(P)-dependent dehydrogenase (short-subunit alcohol dehydrogenase family)
VLVNNAGTAIPKPFEESTLEEMDRVIDTDGDNHRCLHAGDSRERASNGQLNQSGIEKVGR